IALVDGAVQDNQGTASLLAEGCNNVIVSDAAGQIPTVASPAGGPLSVITRCNNILQDRVRDVQFRELCSRRRAATLRLTFLHLPKGVTSGTVEWLGRRRLIAASQPAQRTSVCTGGCAGGKTPYGICQDIQRLLLNLR